MMLHEGLWFYAWMRSMYSESGPYCDGSTIEYSSHRQFPWLPPFQAVQSVSGDWAGLGHSALHACTIMRWCTFCILLYPFVHLEWVPGVQYGVFTASDSLRPRWCWDYASVPATMRLAEFAFPMSMFYHVFWFVLCPNIRTLAPGEESDKQTWEMMLKKALLFALSWLSFSSKFLQLSIYLVNSIDIPKA